MPSLKYHIEFRANNLDQYIDKDIKYILAPSFSVVNDVYPNIYGLFSELKNIPSFFPIGCSFQHISASHNVFEENVYSTENKKVFHDLLEKMQQPLLCRDALITNMLQKNDIDALYCGDLAIYDEEFLNKPFVAPEKINSLVFTIGHHEKYETQSYVLLNLIKYRFPDSKLYISYHSKIHLRSKKIGNYAISLGYEEKYMFGDVENLEFYNDIDLHIGYRLHGHISFLRKRKPSVLLVEDARAYGFANTKGTHIGCFNAVNSDQTVNNLAPFEAMKFVEEQIEKKFDVYDKVFSFIDQTFNAVIVPALDQLIKKLD